MAIPTFIIEEHHEAFIVWNYAIQQGLIPATGNTLFHVDEHSDMGTPSFNESIYKLNGDFEYLKEFTYNELNIATFIIPAVYNQVFKKIYWIRQKHKTERKKSTKMFVRSYNQAGKRLISGKIKDIDNTKEDIDRIHFDYYLRTIEVAPSQLKVILDIDLDYFSCTGNPNDLEELYIEITKNEYDSYISNRYHRLNFQNIKKIEAIKKGDMYFYVFNNFKHIYPTNSKVDENEIDIRINKLIKVLFVKGIKPDLISICRSAFSNYTPKNQVDYIQNTLFKKLKDIYVLDSINFKNI